MTTRPRMIERWFPCEQVSASSDKGWGSGNSEANLFTWFAKRPLAQAKAAVITSLLPWPDDPSEQQRLQKLVREAFPNPDDPNGRDAGYDDLAQELSRHYPDGATMLDPFSGRAMIPLEAARLGLKAIGIDYSPVATLAGRLLADYPLRNWDDEPPLPFDGYESTDPAHWGKPRLLRDVEFILELIGDRYEAAMDEFYPKVEGRRPWGYLWAVTLPCVECGRRFPLTGSLVLRHPLPKKQDPGQSYRIVADPASGIFDVVVHTGPPEGQPTVVNVQGRRGKSAICPFCQHVHTIDVHTRLMNQGLAEDVLLVVADLDNEYGKVFRASTEEERQAAKLAEAALAQEPAFGPTLPAVPDERIPPGNHDTVRPSKYGYRSYGELCNPRQTLGFVRLCQLIDEVGRELRRAGASPAYAEALVGFAAACLPRRLRLGTRGAPLKPRRPGNSNRVYVSDIFQNEASIAFSYDHFETGCGNGPGTWRSVAKDTMAALRAQLERRPGLPARVERGSALALPLKSASVDAVVTDPPYDSMIDYTDASDLFFVWLKRALVSSDPGFAITAHPLGVQEKAEEIIVKRGGTAVSDHRDDEFYNTKLAESLAEARRVVSEDGVVTIVFGHNDPDVWRELLEAITSAGLVLTGTWPALTEKGGGAGSANIVTTMTLACRAAPAKRPEGRSEQVGAEVRREVVNRIPLWEQAGLALPDQKMAAYGPAMEIVGRYSRVLDHRGEPEDPQKFLLLARQAVEDAADIRIDGLPLGTFDARTRFALAWVREHGRGVVDAAQERWQRLTAQAVTGSALDLDGLVKKVKGGVRFVFGHETTTDVQSGSPIIDVALALARVGRNVSAAAEVLDGSGRSEDDHLWSAVAELGRRFSEADRDGEVWIWLTRNRKALVSEAGSFSAGRERRAREDQERGDQRSMFDQEEQ